MNALVAGHVEPAAALTSALRESGMDSELHAVAGTPAGRSASALADSIVELERRLIDEKPALAVAVGFGDAPLALAISAAKLGIPLVAWVEQGRFATEEAERTEARIMLQLADVDAGPVGDGSELANAAQRIREWAEQSLEPRS